MATENTPERRHVTVELHSAAPVVGKYGPQWEISLTYPWSKFPSKAWLERDFNGSPIMPGPYECLVERGKLKQGKFGDADWDWNWSVVLFDAPTPFVDAQPSGGSQGTQPPPKPPQGAPAPAQGSYDNVINAREAAKQDSIHRQVALKAAVEYLAAHDDDIVVTTIAQLFYDWLSGKEGVEVTLEKECGSAEQGVIPEEPTRAPAVNSVGDLLNWAKDTYKVESRQEVLEALGVTTQQEIVALGLDQARDRLVGAWGEPA